VCAQLLRLIQRHSTPRTPNEAKRGADDRFSDRRARLEKSLGRKTRTSGTLGNGGTSGFPKTFATFPQRVCKKKSWDRWCKETICPEYWEIRQRAEQKSIEELGREHDVEQASLFFIQAQIASGRLRPTKKRLACRSFLDISKSSSQNLR